MTVDQFARMLAVEALHKSGVPFTEEEKQKLADLDKIAAMQDDIEINTSGIATNTAALVDVVNAGQKNLLDTSKLPDVFSVNGVAIKNNRDGALVLEGNHNSSGISVVVWNFNYGVYGGSTVSNNQIEGKSLNASGDYIVDTGTTDETIRLQIIYSDDAVSGDSLCSKSEKK